MQNFAKYTIHTNRIINIYKYQMGRLYGEEVPKEQKYRKILNELGKDDDGLFCSREGDNIIDKLWMWRERENIIERMGREEQGKRVWESRKRGRERKKVANWKEKCQAHQCTKNMQNIKRETNELNAEGNEFLGLKERKKMICYLSEDLFTP